MGFFMNAKQNLLSLLKAGDAGSEPACAKASADRSGMTVLMIYTFLHALLDSTQISLHTKGALFLIYN